MSLDVRIFLIICDVGVFILTYIFIMPKKAIGMYPGGAYNIVNENDIKTIEIYNKSKTFYAIKKQENNKCFLELCEGKDSVKYSIDKEKFESIREGTYYWFYIKFAKPGEVASGSIENVYTSSPLK
jgi:hypothetical protein